MLSITRPFVVRMALVRTATIVMLTLSVENCSRRCIRMAILILP